MHLCGKDQNGRRRVYCISIDEFGVDICIGIFSGRQSLYLGNGYSGKLCGVNCDSCYNAKWKDSVLA